MIATNSFRVGTKLIFEAPISHQRSQIVGLESILMTITNFGQLMVTKCDRKWSNVEVRYPIINALGL